MCEIGLGKSDAQPTKTKTAEVTLRSLEKTYNRNILKRTERIEADDGRSSRAHSQSAGQQDFHTVCEAVLFRTMGGCGVQKWSDRQGTDEKGAADGKHEHKMGGVPAPHHIIHQQAFGNFNPFRTAVVTDVQQ
jgi:hypothetical protein